MTIMALASRFILATCLLVPLSQSVWASNDPDVASQVVPTDRPLNVRFEAPASVPQFDVAEFTARLDQASDVNPFTEMELTGEFAATDQPLVRVHGFCDSQDGRVFRLRFCPGRSVAYHYVLRLRCRDQERTLEGDLIGSPSNRPGPVIVDPEHPKHFIRAGSREPFYHLGFTAYHLLDPSNDDIQVADTIDYCARLKFNKIRFLLAGYPRDFDQRTSRDVEHGVVDPQAQPNYGAPPGQLNSLPAWLGTPHAYDFERFHVDYWQRVDRAVRLMRELGIVATCVITIEKQDLPAEYGALSEHEYRLYRYAVARLAAFDNIWWDLGNEHNEYRDVAWGETMGTFVRDCDPFQRLASAHAYADFLYPQSKWPGFIVTQQYGDEKSVHDWVLRYADVAKPYINEEYGYEGEATEPGHSQNADWVRRCHWSIAMAGGYATYGDWSGGVAYFYMGQPGPGKAANQLQHLRTFFESLPYRSLQPHDAWNSRGFCLANPAQAFIFYFPRGGSYVIDLSAATSETLTARWYDPRQGRWQGTLSLVQGTNSVVTPSDTDWVLRVDLPNSHQKGQ